MLRKNIHHDFLQNSYFHSVLQIALHYLKLPDCFYMDGIAWIDTANSLSGFAWVRRY